MTARNVRAYQTRGLLPSPLRDGRSAIYDDAHLQRLQQIHELRRTGVPLRMISEAVSRGESLGTDGPLHAWASGQLSSPPSSGEGDDFAPRVLDLAALERAERAVPGATDKLSKMGLLAAHQPGEAVGGALSALIMAIPSLADAGVDVSAVLEASVDVPARLQNLVTQAGPDARSHEATARLVALTVHARLSSLTPVTQHA